MEYYLGNLKENMDNKINEIVDKLNITEEKKENRRKRLSEYVEISMKQKVPLRIYGVGGIDSYFPSKKEFLEKENNGEPYGTIQII